MKLSDVGIAFELSSNLHLSIGWEKVKIVGGILCASLKVRVIVTLGDDLVGDIIGTKLPKVSRPFHFEISCTIELCVYVCVC